MTICETIIEEEMSIYVHLNVFIYIIIDLFINETTIQIMIGKNTMNLKKAKRIKD
jgi:hypothetical protein